MQGGYLIIRDLLIACQIDGDSDVAQRLATSVPDGDVVDLEHESLGCP